MASFDDDGRSHPGGPDAAVGLAETEAYFAVPNGPRLRPPVGESFAGKERERPTAVRLAVGEITATWVAPQNIDGHQGAGSEYMAAESLATAPCSRSVTRPAAAREPSLVPPR
jgi:hypothetical protein